MLSHLPGGKTNISWVGLVNSLVIPLLIKNLRNVKYPLPSPFSFLLSPRLSMGCVLYVLYITYFILYCKDMKGNILYFINNTLILGYNIKYSYVHRAYRPHVTHIKRWVLLLGWTECTVPNVQVNVIELTNNSTYSMSLI